MTKQDQNGGRDASRELPAEELKQAAGGAGGGTHIPIKIKHNA